MACCKCCCGGENCTEGQQGKCCCGGPSGTCCKSDEYCCSGSCQSDPCSGGACCLSDGTCSDEYEGQEMCESDGGTWHPGKTCADSPCVVGGACCIEGTCDPDKGSQSECESAGGVWVPNVTCDEYPCQGGCCCTDGYIDQYITSQSACENCDPPTYSCGCFENLSLEDTEAPCPEGWSGSDGWCYKFSTVSNCSECVSTVEGSYPWCDCYPTNNPICGTWYPECAVARKYVAYINYTWSYYYACGPGAMYLGPKGTCAFYFSSPPCLSDLDGSVGIFDTYEECQAFYDNVIDTQPEGIYTSSCDWPPAVGSGCQQICIDTTNPFP